MLTQSNASRNGSKPTRNSDLRHAQGVGRQRKAKAAPSTQHNAACIATIVRKRISEGQPIEDLSQYNLDDDTWAELISVLNDAELAAVNASGQSTPDDEPPSGQSEPDHDKPASDTEPAPAPKAELPGWRGAFPAHTHGLTWVDSEGISHSHTVRSDDIDEVLRQVRTVKAFIAASKARARDEKPVEPEQAQSVCSEPEKTHYVCSEPEHEQAESAYDEPTERTRIWCERHQTWLHLRQKNGQQWYSHKTAEGWCRRGVK